MDKIRIGVIGVAKVNQQKDEIRVMLKTMDEKLKKENNVEAFVCTEPLFNEALIQDTAKKMELDERVDVLVVIVGTWVFSSHVISAVNDLSIPFVLFGESEEIANGNFGASIQIRYVLQEMGKHGGYDELMDYLDEAQSIAYRFGAHPEQHIAKRVGTGQLVRGVKTKVLGDMEIKYDLCGIISIIKNGKDLFGEYRLKKQCYNWSDSRQVRIGELALMDDWGSAYSWYRLSEPLLLGQYNYAVIEKDDCLWWRGRRDVGDPSAKVLQWDIVIRLSEDGKRLNFVTDIDWDTTNRRIKVLIPVNDSDSKKSTWEIPFGFLEREYDPGETHDEFAASQINDCIASPDNMQRIKKLSECGENDFKPNACAEYDLNGLKITGEYPALHWVRHDINEKESVSILNKGIPSARWIPGCFEISLLRSPQMHSTLTVLPHIEDMWDIDGYTDKGKHRFEYSIWPEIDSLSYSELVKAGYEYNKANPDFPFDVEGDVVVTAFKLAENGDGFVLRVQEASGKESKVRIDFKEKILFEVVNLMEKTIGEKTTGSEFATTLRPYEIKSFRLRK